MVFDNCVGGCASVGLWQRAGTKILALTSNDDACGTGGGKLCCSSCVGNAQAQNAGGDVQWYSIIVLAVVRRQRAGKNEGAAVQ